MALASHSVSPHSLWVLLNCHMGMHGWSVLFWGLHINYSPPRLSGTLESHGSFN
jgi:hypothetical protein